LVGNADSLVEPSTLETHNKNKWNFFVEEKTAAHDIDTTNNSTGLYIDKLDSNSSFPIV
jgi:hypothetical protein